MITDIEGFYLLKFNHPLLRKLKTHGCLHLSQSMVLDVSEVRLKPYQSGAFTNMMNEGCLES